MRVVRHPLVEQDLAALADHVVGATDGCFATANRRRDEIDALVANVIANPMSGARVAFSLDGWFIWHGGSGHRITIVFRPDKAKVSLFVTLVAYGTQNWAATAEARKTAYE